MRIHALILLLAAITTGCSSSSRPVFEDLGKAGDAISGKKLAEVKQTLGTPSQVHYNRPGYKPAYKNTTEWHYHGMLLDKPSGTHKDLIIYFDDATEVVKDYEAR